MEFEWDENKNKSNQDKHDVSFNQATEAFNDPNKTETVDDRKNYGEIRRKIIAKALDLLLSIVFTMRGTIRLISARAASQKERKDYNAQKKESDGGK